MTDIEIDKALALAIGWTEDRIDEGGLLDPDVAEFGGSGYADEVKVWSGEVWRTFSYTDPTVIWPIAERYNAFPYALRDKSGKLTGMWNVLTTVDHIGDTAARAVALAVIGMAKKARSK